MSQDVWSIALLTFVASFGVQYCFYLYYRYKSHPIIKTHKAVVSYTSGIIGDAILMPLTNIFTYSVLKGLNFEFSLPILLWSIFGGVVTFGIFHWGQEYFKLENWTMPQNGLWNLLGVYHAIFMFAESTFLVFVLLNYFQHWTIYGFSSISTNTLLFGVLAMVIFFITFVYDYWDSLFKRFFKK